MTSKVFKLSKPIKKHGKGGAEEIRALELREPIADDVFELPQPWTSILINGGVDYRMEGSALKAWIARLSGISAGEFGAMAARDVRAIYDWLFSELNVPGEDKEATKN